MLKDYSVELKSPVSNSFRCQKAANSLDIDTEKKSIHRLNIKADIDSGFNVGLILGASGSGKTTLAKSIFGENCFGVELDQSLPIIEQMPDSLTYEECASILSGVGLTSVPCWIRPVYTLSNGQKSRAEIALTLSKNEEVAIVDEWTSVVDRTAAKVMSHCVQKYCRRNDKMIILLSCHYDVIEWLNPDWVIDCNKQSYTDRRSLCRSYDRKEKLEFAVCRAGKSSWNRFSKYHYMSEKMPGGHIECFGLYHGDEQIGFCCFANYVPWSNKKRPKQMHSNRVVIHPDFAGFGLGIKFVNACSKIMSNAGFDVRAKLSAKPLIKSRLNQPDKWKVVDIRRDIKTVLTGNIDRKTGYRTKVKTYSFKWVGSPILKGEEVVQLSTQTA